MKKMDIFDQIINLSESWSRHYPSLKGIRHFIESLDASTINLSSQIKLLNTDNPPQTLKDVIKFHQRLTEVVYAFQGDQLKSGNFQTKPSLALDCCNQVLGYYTSKGMNNLHISNQVTVTDPTCGTGVFLLSFLHSWIEGNPLDPKVRIHLQGIDINPLSLLVAWICLSIAKDILDCSITFKLCNSDLLDVLQSQKFKSNSDFIIGNPPWITWTDLDDTTRESWKNFNQQSKFDYITASGMEKAMGAANIDIGPLIFLFAIQHLATNQAIFGFLFKPNRLNSPTLYWYRRGKFPHISTFNLALTHVMKIKGSGHFIGVTLSTDWYQGQVSPSLNRSFIHILSNSRNNLGRSTSFTDKLYRVKVDDPLDFFYLPSPNYEILSNSSDEVEIRHGIKHDCRDVFELELSQAKALDWQAVYPTIKSRHVKVNGWTGKNDYVLVPNKSLKNIDKEEFASTYPLAYQYLSTHKEQLLKRKSRWLKTGPFYSIFGVGEYSFSTYKVVWVRLGWKPYFTLITPVTLPNGEVKPVVPSDHYLFIPTENYEYGLFLVKLLNSQPYQTILNHLSSKKKSSLPKKLVSRLHIPSEEEFENSEELTSDLV